MLSIPAPRRSSVLLVLWRWPTSSLGGLIARVLRAEGPFPVGNARAPARYYLLPDRDFLWFGAVTLGHVILAQRRAVCGERGRWTMVHELAHTRQHDVLGPLYLPTHGVLQLVSALLTLVSPLPGYTPWHAHNPLERSFLCVPFDFLVRLRKHPELGRSPEARRVLEAFGMEEWECTSPPEWPFLR